MNIKQQNKELTQIKFQVSNFLNALEFKLQKALELTGCGEESAHLMWDYLISGMSLKTLRKELNHAQAENLLHQKLNHQLTWFKVDGGWEAVSAACYGEGDHMSWRFVNKGKFYLDDSPGELRTDEVEKAKFKTLGEAQDQYQIWENEMVKEMGK
jgi:hypothetical protein